MLSTDNASFYLIVPKEPRLSCLATTKSVITARGAEPSQKKTLARSSLKSALVHLAVNHDIRMKFRNGSANELRCNG